MTLWHLAWMHLTLLAIFAGVGALPFTWWVAVAWTGEERFKTKRAYLWARAGRPSRARYEPTEEIEE